MNVHDIYDADHRRINRRTLSAKRLTGCAPLEHDQHALIHTGTDAVDGEQRRSARCRVEVQGLHEEQLRSFERPVLLGRHNGSHYSANQHRSRRSVRLEQTTGAVSR
jgi:hypothetical protein